jgi:quercetin dioxygenase-like cupin family protein
MTIRRALLRLSGRGLGLLCAAAAPAAAQQPAQVTYVDAATVAEAFAKGGRLASGSDYTAAVSVRTAAGQVEVHDKETDIFYVVEGSATFVTGGRMIGGTQPRPDQWLGTDIDGGQVHHLKTGDVIVIPAGVPHWFKDVPVSVRYYMVKSVRP